jgi:hypothetical protein
MTKSPIADWSNPNCNRLNEKSAPEYIKVGITTQNEKLAQPEYIKVVITTQNEKSAQPVKRHPSSAPARLYK